MYGLKTSGTTTDPSSCWLFSRMATIKRGTAAAVALRVWQNAVVPPVLDFFLGGSAPLLASGPGLGLYRMLSRLLW